jgi:cell division protein ZapA (FtsZ GTPase activity inhibitor)
MNEILLIIVSSLTTLSTVLCLACLYLAQCAQKANKNAKQIADDLATAHNKNQETIENIIRKMDDIQMQVAMHRQQTRKSL